ncbi:MAG TPA: DNA polymerase/3'-5' exonuclease PolX [Candidatus Polarisedimenticolia bacterium]|nr:DNA polymerase/3'-5' exonuclease PolX [Candidatus Polarisedimenticolia bacterium]
MPKREVPLPPIDDEVDPPSNAELARVLHEIGDMLEVKGELVFKTVAYHRAADAVERSAVEVARRFRAGDPPQIPGVGAAIADKLDELSRTGRLEYHERLLSEFPPTLLDLLRLPGLGPKTVRLIWTSLGIATLEDLQAAAEGGRLRSLRGLSEATEKRVLAAIEGLGNRDQRLLLNQAEAIIEDVTAVLSIVPGVRTIEPAGSFRRKRESIGDIDLLAETDDPAGLVERFVTLARADTILGRGTHKAAVRLGGGGPQIDLMIMGPGQAGTYRIHFTGSKEHNVRLRAIARDRGWSLSEYGFARIGEDGEPLTGEAAELRTFATEAEAYAFLALPFIEPELREDRGEIEAARAGTLPNLVTLDDLRGDLHSHSDWTDGSEPIEVMAEAARRRGHAYQVLTDHTQSLAITRGLAPDRVRMQRKIVAKLNELYAAEEDAGTAPPETPAEGFRLLHGCELEIRADNRLDYDDDLLASYDVVVASLHVSRRQPRSELTARVLTAIRNPHVDVIAHPAGRMIGTRDDLDLDWDVVYREAARTGTALEINGSPHRLDLAVERARLAVSLGCIVAVDSDAHRTSEFDYLRWGITQARRAWIEPANVVNTRGRAELLRWAAER